MSCLQGPQDALIVLARGYRAAVGRKVDVGHLVGARTAAERLGLVRVQALHHLRRVDPAFPEAVYWTTRGQGGTGVWYWPDIWRWARASGHPAFADGRLVPLGRPSSSPSRRVDVDGLVDGRQLGRRLGLRHPRSFHLIVTTDATFPDAVFSSTGGPSGTQLWVWPDVWRWARRRGRSLPAEYERLRSGQH